MTPGELIRETRARRGLSQQRLARRVGTHQSAISRLEADKVSPSVETLDLLMRAMGERLNLSTGAHERDYDPLHRQATADRSPDERLALGISWNRMAGRLAAAGRQAVAKSDTSLDAESVFRTLTQHDVKYLLVGGLAMQVHGHVRTTNDIDLIAAPGPASLKRLKAALRSLDGGVDVMHEVPGGRPYAELAERALHVRLGDIDVPVVDLDDLIHMKLARGRAVDLADVAALTDPNVEP